ncbi:alpha-2 adrenergic receptor [Trichonephila clavipes]|nr:alpha-2 adrenergic receptor [Trichonephila clavipes]
MKIGNNGNLVLGPFDESTPCLMIVLMNCQTKLRINHLTAVKSVAIVKMVLSLQDAGRVGKKKVTSQPQSGCERLKQTGLREYRRVVRNVLTNPTTTVADIQRELMTSIDHSTSN